MLLPAKNLVFLKRKKGFHLSLLSPFQPLQPTGLCQVFKSVNVSFKSLYSRPSFIKDSSSQVAHALTGHVPAYCPLQNLVLLLSWKSPSLRLNSKACLTNLQHSFFFRHIYYLQLTNFTLQSGNVSLQQIVLHSKFSPLKSYFFLTEHLLQCPTATFKCKHDENYGFSS